MNEDAHKPILIRNTSKHCFQLVESGAKYRNDFDFSEKSVGQGGGYLLFISTSFTDRSQST